MKNLAETLLSVIIFEQFAYILSQDLTNGIDLFLLLDDYKVVTFWAKLWDKGKTNPNYNFYRKVMLENSEVEKKIFRAFTGCDGSQVS